MIVVDTNVLAYLLITGERSTDAERALAKDPVWAVPLIWRSELRNGLALYIRQRRLTYDCEFVALAQDLNVQLVTDDRRILNEFPRVAISVAKFARDDEN